MIDRCDCRSALIDVQGSGFIKNVSNEGFSLYFMWPDDIPHLLIPGEAATTTVPDLTTVRISPYAPAAHVDYEISYPIMSAPRNGQFGSVEQKNIIDLMERAKKNDYKY